jgi:hypothetical protein
MKAKCTIIEIQDLEIFSNGKKKQTVIIEANAEKVPVIFYDENIIDAKVGETGIVFFKIKGEQFQEKNTTHYFPKLVGTKFEKEKTTLSEYKSDSVEFLEEVLKGKYLK